MTKAQKRRIRAHTKIAYDAQDMRLRVGGRVVQNFRAKLGLDNEDTDPDDDDNILQKLKRRYKLITDGIALDKLSRRREYEYDGVITEYGELILINNYLRLKAQEERLFRELKKEIAGTDIWVEFLSDVKGVGPAMAGVIISEFNPHHGKYVSSFWKYAGLDTVSTWHLVEVDGERIKKRMDRPPKDADFNEARDRAEKDGEVWEKIRVARTRREPHLREVEYEDSNGEMKTRKSLTYNKFLHDKLLGVLGPCLMRAGGHYKDVYDDYRNRLESDERGQSDGHRHRMAIRYMVKMFVKDLYNAWRPLEGLPVHDPYAEAKLKGQPHGDSE